MAYDPRLASALSGATLAQLAYWRRGDRRLLVPEVSQQPRVLYSFRDLVALRTFVFLREERSLQKIRRALDTLEVIGETRHLSEYKLLAQGKNSIVLLHDLNDGAVDLVERPGQQVAVIALSDVLQAFPVAASEIEVPALEKPRKRISVNPAVRSGYPVIEGTRIAYDLVAGLVRDGVPPDELKDYYPGVSAAAARDAVSFADYVDQTQRRAS